MESRPLNRDESSAGRFPSPRKSYDRLENYLLGYEGLPSSAIASKLAPAHREFSGVND